MRCLRIYATPDGESHFDEVEMPMTKLSVHSDATPFEVSASYQASRVRFTSIPAGMREVSWHTVPEPSLRIEADFVIPSAPTSALRVSFDTCCIVRILDEMPLSTEEDTGPREGGVAEQFAYRVEGAAFEAAQSPA